MAGKLLMECVGTMFLVLAVGLTGNPLAIGLMLAVMIYVGGHVSGGHYNPAVSLAVMLRGKLGGAALGAYMVAQLLGAMVAAILIVVLTGSFLSPAPGADVALWRAILAEALFTFALCSVVLAVATAKGTEGNHVYGFAIGLTVTAGAFAVGPVSGAAFNPAVGVGPILIDLLHGGDGAENLLLYLVGPFVGALLAAPAFKLWNPEG